MMMEARRLQKSKLNWNLMWLCSELMLYVSQSTGSHHGTVRRCRPRIRATNQICRAQHQRRYDRERDDDRLDALGVTGHANERDTNHEPGDTMEERGLRDERVS